MKKRKNKSLKLTMMSDYGETLLTFEFAQILSSNVQEGYHFLECRTKDGRVCQLATKRDVFIEELKD